MRWSLLAIAALGCGRIDFAAVGDATADSTPASASCATPIASCGPQGDEDCCARRTVPGGTFARSFDVATDLLYADASNTATVSPFVLDRFEVTVARFRAFVDRGSGTQVTAPAAGEGARETIPGSGWDASWTARLSADQAGLLASINCEPDMGRQTWTDAPGPTDARPMNCVSYYLAFAFCVWDGGWLPTEAEWNFAAAGGDEQRAYPWSTPPGLLNQDCARARYGACPGNTTVPGALSPAGDGRWEHADLAGNVWEWVLDHGGTYTNPCIDCANLAPTDASTMIRGGSFFDTPTTLRVPNRIATGGLSTAIGFRCGYPE